MELRHRRRKEKEKEKEDLTTTRSYKRIKARERRIFKTMADLLLSIVRTQSWCFKFRRKKAGERVESNPPLRLPHFSFAEYVM